jgi:hypothetical protein
MEPSKIQKIGGICAILEALIYIGAFIVYGGVLSYPSADAGIQEKLNFLSNNYLTLSILNFTSYVLFGILLAVLVLTIHERLKESSPFFSKVASVFGVTWVVLVIASGMIANIGMNSVIEMGATEPERAMTVWLGTTIVSEALGGGNEIVGGIWVLMLSIIALKGKLFSIPLSCLGMAVGLAGIMTIYPLDLFTDIFGLSQIIWFIWVGVVMLKTRN